jgi:hypothetical protein
MGAELIFTKLYIINLLYTNFQGGRLGRNTRTFARRYRSRGDGHSRFIQFACMYYVRRNAAIVAVWQGAVLRPVWLSIPGGCYLVWAYGKGSNIGHYKTGME